MRSRFHPRLLAAWLLVLSAAACGTARQAGKVSIAALTPEQRQQLLTALVADDAFRADLLKSALTVDDQAMRRLAGYVSQDEGISEQVLAGVIATPLRIKEQDLDKMARVVSKDAKLREEIRERYRGPELRVSRLEVTDAKGRVRLSLGSMTGNAIGQTLYDASGTERIRVGIEQDGTARSRILTHDGKPAVSAASWPPRSKAKNRGGLTLYDAEYSVTNGDTKIRTALSATGIRLYDKDQKNRVSILSDNTRGWSGLWLAPGDEKSPDSTVRLVTHRDGASHLDMLKGASSRYYDNKGKRRLKLTGDDGKGNAAAWWSDESGAEKLVLYAPKTGQGYFRCYQGSRILLHDEKGRERMLLGGATSKGRAGAWLFDTKGDARIGLLSPDSGVSSLRLYRGSQVFLYDAADRSRLTVAGDNGNGWAGAWMYDAQSRQRMQLVGSRNGDTELNFSDANNKTRASIASFNNGFAHALVNDARGKPAWFSETDGTGTFRNFRKMTAGEEAWDLAGKASTIGAGLQLLFGGNDKKK